MAQRRQRSDRGRVERSDRRRVDRPDRRRVEESDHRAIDRRFARLRADPTIRAARAEGAAILTALEQHVAPADRELAILTDGAFVWVGLGFAARARALAERWLAARDRPELRRAIAIYTVAIAPPAAATKLRALAGDPLAAAAEVANHVFRGELRAAIDVCRRERWFVEQPAAIGGVAYGVWALAMVDDLDGALAVIEMWRPRLPSLAPDQAHVLLAAEARVASVRHHHARERALLEEAMAICEDGLARAYLDASYAIALARAGDLVTAARRIELWGNASTSGDGRAPLAGRSRERGRAGNRSTTDATTEAGRAHERRRAGNRSTTDATTEAGRAHERGNAGNRSPTDAATTEALSSRERGRVGNRSPTDAATTEAISSRERGRTGSRSPTDAATTEALEVYRDVARAELALLAGDYRAAELAATRVLAYADASGNAIYGCLARFHRVLAADCRGLAAALADYGRVAIQLQIPLHLRRYRLLDGRSPRQRSLVVRGRAGSRREPVLRLFYPAMTDLGADLCWDRVQGTLYLGGEGPRSLADHPILERVLAAIVDAPGFALPLARLFEAVWEMPFDPLRHEGKCHVALHRLRGLLGGWRTGADHLIEVADGVVRIARSAGVCTIELPGHGPARHDSLVERVAEHLATSGDVAPAELVTRLGISRSALHGAVRVLLAAGRVECVGRGRATRYRSSHASNS